MPPLATFADGVRTVDADAAWDAPDHPDDDGFVTAVDPVVVDNDAATVADVTLRL